MAQIMRAGSDETKRFEAMLPAIERGIDMMTHEKGIPLFSKSPLNRLTWDWDVAAKRARSDSYKKLGYSDLQAGVEASNDLVNYANRSPVAEAIKYFVPFASFAEGGAKSVLSATGRSPALVEDVNRLSTGKMLGGGQHGKDTTVYVPSAQVGRGLFTYLRSKTAEPIKLAAAEAAAHIPGGKGKGFANWLLGGETPRGAALDILTSPIPYMRDILNAVPLPGTGKTIRGFKPDDPLNQGVFSATGISLPNRPVATPKPAAAATGANPFNMTP
jgi:hypothetical protein